MHCRALALTAIILTACSTGAKHMYTTLDLNPETLGTTIPALCMELTKKPTAEAVAASLGKVIPDPDNPGTILLIAEPPPTYERIQIHPASGGDDAPRVTLSFRYGQGPSAATLSNDLGAWQTMPIEEHSMDLDRLAIFQKSGVYTCRILAAVERPSKPADRGTLDHVRELRISVFKW